MPWRRQATSHYLSQSRPRSMSPYGVTRPQPWWRHQMETFNALLAFGTGNSPVTGEFPAQRPVTRSFDVFLDLRLNRRLSKQSWGWWFETQSCSLWRHCNDELKVSRIIKISSTWARWVWLTVVIIFIPIETTSYNYTNNAGQLMIMMSPWSRRFVFHWSKLTPSNLTTSHGVGNLGHHWFR